MAITVAQLHEHLEAARSALASGDHATAATQAEAALAVLAGLPNSEQVQWRETIERLLRVCDKGISQAAATAAGGIRRTKVTYTGVTD